MGNENVLLLLVNIITLGGKFEFQMKEGRWPLNDSWYVCSIHLYVIDCVKISFDPSNGHNELARKTLGLGLW